jgi:hypothetical protein
MVARSTRDDPVGHLFVTNQISQQQRAVIDAYQHDVEALDGRLRAASRPDDTAWRGQRFDGDAHRHHRNRLERAQKAWGPVRTRMMHGVLIGGMPFRNGDLREFHQALGELAVAYGFATPTRH